MDGKRLYHPKHREMDGKAMVAEYAELSGSAGLAYADVLDNAMARELDTGVGFNFLKRENKSGAYWYLQHSFAGKKKQFYIGADTEDVRNAISVTESRWALDRVEAVGMQKLVAMATKGVPDPARNLDWLSQEDLWAFRGSFERDNEQLRRRFAPTLPSPLFPMPERTRKTQFTGLSPERAIQIAQHFFGAE